ncbi:hypothetical protein [Kribbella catacumbae]|uniref:hypothetical protein n=1 Tax=Kribbella catacumbae TaxID=460086 RepID=UPI00036671BF|nr:hypothetical protein [Kribbella catacumbae]
MNSVWYVAYGSNLAIDRFRCYVAGGRPAGGMREYAGCRDPSDPESVLSLEIPGGDFARAVSAVVDTVETAHVLGPGRYETITRVAVRDGVPMLTMTNGEAATLKPSAPSAAYLRWIAAGLREAHGWDGEQIADYLSAMPGASGTLEPRRAGRSKSYGIHMIRFRYQVGGTQER